MVARQESNDNVTGGTIGGTFCVKLFLAKLPAKGLLRAFEQLAKLAK